MPTAEELEKRVTELAEDSVTGQEVAVAIFTENYETPVKELSERLDMSPLGRRPRQRECHAAAAKGPLF